MEHIEMRSRNRSRIEVHLHNAPISHSRHARYEKMNECDDVKSSDFMYD